MACTQPLLELKTQPGFRAVNFQLTKVLNSLNNFLFKYQNILELRLMAPWHFSRMAHVQRELIYCGRCSYILIGYVTLYPMTSCKIVFSLIKFCQIIFCEMIFCEMIFCKMIFCKMIFYKMIFCQNDILPNDILPSIILQNYIAWSIILLNAILPSILLLNYILRSIILLNDILRSILLPNYILQSIILLNDILQNDILPSIILWSVILPNVIQPSYVLLIVMAPHWQLRTKTSLTNTWVDESDPYEGNVLHLESNVLNLLIWKSFSKLTS